MPHYDLDPIATELVSARMETDNRLRLEGEKFDRFVARRKARISRERENNRMRLSTALGKAIGVEIPAGAAIGVRADGNGVVEWPGPQPAPKQQPEAQRPLFTPEEIKTIEEANADVAADLAKITPMPAGNGALASATAK